MRVAEQRELAVGVAHSHPEGCFVSPSWLDDDMDDCFAKDVARYGVGLPYLSLIIQRSDARGFTFSGRVYDRGEWFSLTTLFTVGEKLESHRAENVSPCVDVSQRFENSESPTARLELLFGARAALRLRNAHVAIIGCSGTGSPAAEVLARAGIGEFTLVDPQRLAPSNLERVHGAYDSDFNSEPYPYKVESLRRHILAINPKAVVTTFVGNVLHDNVIDELLRCDVVLICVDTVHGRAALSDMAKHYLLPSIDLGVRMSGTEGKVTNQNSGITLLGPDLNCVFCGGLLNACDMDAELLSEREQAERRQAAKQAAARGDDPDPYWRGQRQLHTVGYLTTLTGALAAGYAEGWLTGAFGAPHTGFQFDISRPNFGFAPTASDNRCECSKHIGWSDQAKSYRNVSRPPYWPSRAIMLHRGSGAK